MAEITLADGAVMSAAVDPRNPTGITFTQDQMDESERQGYWHHAIEYALDYYIAGRFAVSHYFNPVSANILHHAIELMLKACLAHDDSIDKIRKYGSKSSYGHDLVALWREFKFRQTVPPAMEFDSIIEGLHAFEDIRYPETLIKKGALISIGIFETDGPPIRNVSGETTEKLYVLQLPQIDRLMGLLFGASGANPPAFLPRITDDARGMTYYNMVRQTLFCPPKSSPEDMAAPGRPDVSMS